MDVQRRSTICLCAALAIAAFSGGCQSRQFYFFKDAELTHFRKVSLEIEQPCEPACHETPPPTVRPISPETFEKTPLWDLRLEEALGMAVSNSKIARRLPGSGPATLLLDSPQSLVTVFDPAIQAAGVPGGAVGIGVESALAAFDAQLSTNMLWSKNDRPINVGGFGSQIFAPVLQQDLASFQTQLSKTNMTGGQVFARNNVNYELSNNPTRAVPSAFDVNYEVGFTQPLLAGGGVEFNRIAGPVQGNIAAQVLSGGGVLTARINEDLSLADFEKAMRDMVYGVEQAYWELYVAYRNFDSIRSGRDSALANWRRVKAYQEARAIGGEAVLVSQALSQFYQFSGDLQVALSNLVRAENRLRYMLGLPASDGRLIRPSDDPIRAKVVFDWSDIQVEALTRSVELRRQKSVIRQRELQLIAARNLLLPRLDAVALYRWLGAGDTLIDPNGRGVFPFDGSNAYSTLTDGRYQEWQMGFNFSMPLGFRQQMVTVRNVQLQIARERARLEGQELELSHALTEALRNLEFQYVIAQRRLDQLYSTQEEVKQFALILGSGVQKVGATLIRNTDFTDAIARRTVAEAAFFQSLVDYNRAIAEVHYRKGSLLEYNRVYLAEGPWADQAYHDARDKELRRYSAWPLNYAMRMQPGGVSRGPYSQWGHDGAAPTEGVPPPGAQPTPADLPTPGGAQKPAENAKPNDEGTPKEGPKPNEKLPPPLEASQPSASSAANRQPFPSSAAARPTRSPAGPATPALPPASSQETSSARPIQQTTWHSWGN